MNVSIYFIFPDSHVFYFHDQILNHAKGHRNGSGTFIYSMPKIDVGFPQRLGAIQREPEDSGELTLNN